jgi:hypothetical protein
MAATETPPTQQIEAKGTDSAHENAAWRARFFLLLPGQLAPVVSDARQLVQAELWIAEATTKYPNNYGGELLATMDLGTLAEQLNLNTTKKFDFMTAVQGAFERADAPEVTERLLLEHAAAASRGNQPKL